MIEQLIPRRKYRIHSSEFGDQWQVVSYQKQASDVELTGGETVQHRIDNLIATVTELTTTIQNLKTTEDQTHADLENEINLLEDELRNGLRAIENELMNLEVEGDGADDFIRLRTVTQELKSETEEELDALELKVRALLDFELDPDTTVDIYPYLTDQLDRLRTYIESAFNNLLAILGDGYLYDIFYNTGQEDAEDQSIAAGLKNQHIRLASIAARASELGNMSPPYQWEKYEYTNNSYDSDVIRVDVSTNDTVEWHYTFYYLPVFKLLKVAGYMRLMTRTDDVTVRVHVHIMKKKLRMMYADSYQTMINVYDSRPVDEDTIFIDEAQGVLLTDPENTLTFTYAFWGATPMTYDTNMFGISIGEEGDVDYRPGSFEVWSAQESGNDDRPNENYESIRTYKDTPALQKLTALDTWQSNLADNNFNWNYADPYKMKEDPYLYKGSESIWFPVINLKCVADEITVKPNTPFITLQIREMYNGSPTGRATTVKWMVGDGELLSALVNNVSVSRVSRGAGINTETENNSQFLFVDANLRYWLDVGEYISYIERPLSGSYSLSVNTGVKMYQKTVYNNGVLQRDQDYYDSLLRLSVTKNGDNYSIKKVPPKKIYLIVNNSTQTYQYIDPEDSFFYEINSVYYNDDYYSGFLYSGSKWVSTGGGSGYQISTLSNFKYWNTIFKLTGDNTTVGSIGGDVIYEYQGYSPVDFVIQSSFSKTEGQKYTAVDSEYAGDGQMFMMSNGCYCDFKLSCSDKTLTADNFIVYTGYQSGSVNNF